MNIRARIIGCIAIVCMLLCADVSVASSAFDSDSFDGSSLIFDVTAYGAVPDGRTDCTHAVFTATQALINATLNTTTAPFAAVLYFPAGHFLLNSAPPSQPSDPSQTPSFADFTGVLTKQGYSLTVSGAGIEQTTILVNVSYGLFVFSSAVSMSPPTAPNSISLANMTINSVEGSRFEPLLNVQGASDVALSNLVLNLNNSFIGTATAINSVSFNQVDAVISNPSLNAFATAAKSVTFSSASIVAQPATSMYYCLYFTSSVSSVTVTESIISGWQGVVYLPDSISGSDVSLLSVDFINSQFEQFNTGVLALATSNLAITISGCSFTTDEYVRGTTTAAIALHAFGNASSITISNNTITGPYVAVQINYPITLVMDSNTINDVAFGVHFLSDSGNPLAGPIDQMMKPYVFTNNQFSGVSLGVAAFYQSLTGESLPGAATIEGNTCNGPMTDVLADCPQGQTCKFDNNQGCTMEQAPTMQMFDVTGYGAVGDGVTDCTKAVEAAVAALMATPFGGELFFPQGSYLLSSPPTPCAAPGQGACAYINVNVNASFAMPTARYKITGDSDGVTILWRSDLGSFVQYFVQLNGPSSSIEVRGLVIEAQPAPSSASTGYSAIWGSGNYMYIHDVNITGPTNSSVPLLYKQEGGGSSMLVEYVNLWIDPHVGVGMLATETRGITLRHVQVDSLNSTVPADSKAFAFLWNEYSAYILMDICTFLPGSRRVEMYGDNDGNAMPFAIRNSIFDGVTLVLETELEVEVDQCNFTPGPGGAGGIQILTDFLYENVFLTVTHSLFTNLPYGINSQWGRVTALNNYFLNNTVGIQYSENSQWTPISQPVVLLNNRFTSTLSSQLGVLIGNGDGWIVTNNTCSGPAAPAMVLRCDSSCTQSNNAGCGTKSAAHAKSTIVLSEQ